MRNIIVIQNKKLLYISIVIIALFITMIFLFSFSTSYGASETIYYVSNSGYDGINDGLSPSTPWKTFTKVRLEMIAGTFNEGDTILFNRGDTFTTSSGLNIIVDGLTIGVYGDGDKPVIQGSDLYIFYGIAVNNITIRDLRLETIRRGIAFWGELYSISGGAKNILIDNVDVYHEWERAMQFYYNVSHIIVRNCFIDSKNMCGDSILFRNASYVLVEDSIFVNMNHAGFTFYSHRRNEDDTGWIFDGVSDSWIILRNNKFIVPRRSGDWAYNHSNILFENNVIEYYDGIVEHGGDQVVGAKHLIIRFNTYKDFRAKVFGSTSGYTGTDQFVQSYHSIYHNTMYTPYLVSHSPIGYGMYQYVEYPYGHNISVLNNIIYLPNQDNDKITTITHLDTEKRWSNVEYKNNIILVGDMSSSFIEIKLGWDYKYTLEKMQSSKPFSEWIIFEDNIQEDPKINDDLKLKFNSPAIDSGTWLTETIDSGKSRFIKVEKPQHFFPRVTINRETIKGDNIFVGSNKNLEVLSVDCEHNIIEVNREITYYLGDTVSLSSYSGSAPDIGAHEYEFSYTYIIIVLSAIILCSLVIIFRRRIPFLPL